jgi:3-hydroxymyristoyl/3-hydroxydecanoyl-(acyl carrier protein) dehydratase
MTTQEYLQWPLLATWRVPDEHPVLPGHFPAYPVLPGALLLDWVIGLVSSYPGDAAIQVGAARFPAAARAHMLLRAHGLREGGRVQFAVVTDDGIPLCTGTVDGVNKGSLSS